MPSRHLIVYALQTSHAHCTSSWDRNIECQSVWTFFSDSEVSEVSVKVPNRWQLALFSSLLEGATREASPATPSPTGPRRKRAAGLPHTPTAHSPLGIAATGPGRGWGAVTFQRPRLSVRSRFRGASPASASPAESRVLLVWVLFFPFRLPWNADGKTYPRTLHAPQPSLSEPHGAPALTSGHGMGGLCVSKLQGAVP